MISRLCRALSFIAVCVVANVALGTADDFNPDTAVRWPIKTSLPSGTSLSHSKAIPYADLVKLDDPPGVTNRDHRYQDARIPAFPNTHGLKEGEIVTVTGW